MAEAMFNIQNNLFFADLGFELDEESAQSYTNYSRYWDTSHIDWSDLGFVDSDDIGFDLTEQQLLGDFHQGDIGFELMEQQLLGDFHQGDIGFDLMEQQLLGDFHQGDISTTSREFWPNQISTNLNINLKDSFLPENTQQTDIPPMSLSPSQIFPLLSDSLSPGSSLAPASSTSNCQSPFVQLQTPDIQPLSSFTSLPPPKTHICTICQPHRLFSNPQGLK